jgi:hypothetical protein
MSLQNDSVKQFDISCSGGGAVYVNMKDSAGPMAWNNFVWHIATLAGIGDAYDIAIAKELLLYNAIYRYETGKNGHVKKDYVRFETEADFTMFIMKWS